MSIGAEQSQQNAAKKSTSATIEERTRELKERRAKLLKLRTQAGQMIGTLRKDKANADLTVDRTEEAARLMSAVMTTLAGRIDTAVARE
jgi:hypothetical protein